MIFNFKINYAVILFLCTLYICSVFFFLSFTHQTTPTSMQKPFPMSQRMHLSINGYGVYTKALVYLRMANREVSNLRLTRASLDELNYHVIQTEQRCEITDQLGFMCSCRGCMHKLLNMNTVLRQCRDEGDAALKLSEMELERNERMAVNFLLN